MEQQNQQPTQEKTESKSPIKTNWKYIAIAVGFALVVSSGIAWYANLSTPAPQSTEISNIKKPTLQQTVDTSTPSTSSGQAWLTYRNDRFSFEFRYPQAWKVQETSSGVLELKNPQEQIHISIRSFDASVRGISYCEAYPYDIPRCEQNVVDGFYGTIDWQISDSEANALFDDMSITLDVRPPTTIDSATKAFFRNFLSTFRFVD